MGYLGEHRYGFTVIFYIGHGYYVNGTTEDWPGLDPDENFYYITTDGVDLATFGPERVYDYEIWDQSVRCRVRFVFLWSCYQGREIGGTNTLAVRVRHYGMPSCWLHNTTLSEDGYASADGRGYVFIGWYGPAPYLTRDFEREGREFDDEGYHFLKNFSYAVFKEHYTIASALDYASRKVWYSLGVDDFGESPYYEGFRFTARVRGHVRSYYTKMVVYGDSDLKIGGPRQRPSWWLPWPPWPGRGWRWRWWFFPI